MFQVNRLAKSFLRSFPIAREPDVVVTTLHGLVAVFIEPSKEVPYMTGDVAFFIHDGEPYRIRLVRPMSRAALVRGLRRVVAEVVSGALEVEPVKRGPTG